MSFICFLQLQVGMPRPTRVSERLSRPRSWQAGNATIRYLEQVSSSGVPGCPDRGHRDPAVFPPGFELQELLRQTLSA